MSKKIQVSGNLPIKVMKCRFGFLIANPTPANEKHV
jgi:hypothetical protein